VKAVRVRVVARVRPLLPHELRSAGGGLPGGGGPLECVTLSAASPRSLSLTVPVVASAAAAGAAHALAGALPAGSPTAGHRALLTAAGDVPGTAGGEATVTAVPPPAAMSSVTRSFEFDCVLGPRSSQLAIFEQSGVKEYVDAALQGFQATVFAYGQTGSG